MKDMKDASSWERISSKAWRETNILTRNGVEVGEPCTFIWVYDCGWHIEGHHPYRSTFEFAQNEVNQPIGLLDFYKESGVLPE